MEKIKLKEYVSSIGQHNAAKELGVTQGAICKALQTKREIFVEKTEGGIRAFEVKPFPSHR